MPATARAGRVSFFHTPVTSGADRVFFFGPGHSWRVHKAAPALRRSLTIVLTMLIGIQASPAGQAPAPTRVDQLAWLTGCWQIARGDQVIDEQWMAPRAGVMLGMSRTVRAGRPTATEFVTLRVSDGRVAYEAKPSGQKPASFSATMVSADRAVFENPAHDYPKRIVYERKGDTAITASIDDGRGGKRVEYPFQRVGCGR